MEILSHLGFLLNEQLIKVLQTLLGWTITIREKYMRAETARIERDIAQKTLDQITAQERQKEVRSRVLEFIALRYQCDIPKVIERTGATIQLLAEMQANGDVTIINNMLWERHNYDRMTRPRGGR